MIENINANQIGQTLGKTPLPHPDPLNVRPANDSDATIQVHFADILTRARQAGEADANAVEEARKLLLSGRLTSPENIRSAATNIITSGI
jgi:hypothetical protein